METEACADRQPTEVTQEDRGISLIVRFTVTAYKAMCAPWALALIGPDMYLWQCYPLARSRNGERKKRDNRETSININQVFVIIFQLQ